jgi:amidase
MSWGVRLPFSTPEEGEQTLSLPEFFSTLHRRDRLIASWQRFLSEWDVLLCPVAMTAAFPHCETGAPQVVDGVEVNYWRQIGFTGPFNLTGHPAVVIPIGFDPDGLPIGIQIVARRWEEERLLATAALLAEVAGPFEAPDLSGTAGS